MHSKKTCVIDSKENKCSYYLFVFWSAINLKMNEADTFKFIEIVQGHENLWNISSHGYKDMVKRNVVWDEVGKTFGLTGEKTRNQFKALRDKYRRQKDRETAANRSGAGAYRKETWVFFKHLQFLDNAFKKRRVTDSLAWSADNTGISTDNCGYFSQESQDGSLIENELFLTIEQQRSQQTTSTPLPSLVIDSSTPSPTFSQTRSAKKAKRSVEDIFEDLTHKLMSCVEPPVSQSVELTSSPKYHSAVVDFIVETLGKLNKEEAEACEKELMKVATKFRFNY